MKNLRFTTVLNYLALCAVFVAAAVIGPADQADFAKGVGDRSGISLRNIKEDNGA